jgi:hypothetical protein
MAAMITDGEPLNAALNSGYHLAYLVGAACVAAAILAALLVLKPAPPMAGVERERVLDAGSLGER